MRPLQLEFQAFGPYPEQEKIDFDQLAKKGLFLICGETGSGKTVMLDAMTFALYGKSSGNTRNDFEAMRCTSAKPDVPTFVRFVFEAGGEQYWFERRLERKLKNLKTSYNLLKKDTAGEWQTLLENPKEKELNKKAEQLIGLDYDQFRQVIILPQGQFEKLLTSKSEEKEKILTDIFGEYRWQRIAERMFESASERKEALKSKREKIQNSLAEENCETVQQLSAYIVQKKQEMDAIKTEYDKADYKAQRKSLNEMLALADWFAEYHKLQEQQKAYLAAQDKRDEAQRRLEQAKRADKVRQTILQAQQAEKNLKERQRGYQSVCASKTGYEEQWRIAGQKLAEHNERKPEVELLRKKQAAYESRRPDYQGLRIMQTECAEKKKCLEESLANEKEAKLQFDQYNERLVALNQVYEQKKQHHEDLLHAYLMGIHGQIASELVEGCPCPVCGSVEHPCKAPLTDDSVTKDTVEQAKREADKTHSKLLSCGEKQKQAEQTYQSLGDIRSAAEIAFAAGKAKLQNLTANLIEGVDHLEMLEKKISETSDQIAGYEEMRLQLEDEEKRTRETYTQIQAKMAAMAEEVETAKSQCQAANDNLLQDVRENEFESAAQAKEMLLSVEEMEDLQKRITAHDTNLRVICDRLEEIKQRLENREEPDGATCREKLENIEIAEHNFTSQYASLKAEYERLCDKEKKLLAEGNGMEEAVRQADEDLLFAKKMRGDTGTGLQRYVLGIMFSSVVAAANQMLALVHDGRYRLFRSDDKMQGSNKRGLELKVYDKFSDDPQGRFVNTLSGGEKFLASLALSIGMSTVAGKSGIKIEALFIDEGFGSLDEDSIVDAMNVLNTIQESNGLVGIISHVQILQDRIPTKLVVSKKEGRSHIRETIG